MTHATFTPAVTCRPHAARRHGFRGLFFALSGLWRSRQALAALDADRLADLGLSALDAAREARRAPWNVPTHWLK